MRKSKEMLINMKDVPVYDPSKAYFDQPTYVRQFWKEEFLKIKKGVKIGPYQMSGWLYFHLNIFKTPIPTVNGDKLMHPPLSDNELLIADSLSEAERRNKVLALFGTRGFRKTTFISSHIHYTICTKPLGIYSVIGGNQDDLMAIASLNEKTFSNVTPAFYLPTLNKDWEDYVRFGFKDKSNSGRSYVHAEISITNANDKVKASKEKGAGLSPVGFVIDEVGKFSFKSVLKSALPAFRTPYGFRLQPILSGTSGSMDLAKDAKDVLESPDKWDILNFDYNRLCQHVPDEFITWKDDKGKPFGTFVPGQMSSRITVKKKKTSLGEYLRMKHPELDKIEVQVTDWEKATAFVKDLHKRGETGKDKEAQDDRVYFPLKIDDIFLTKGNNPFPIHAINRRIKEIEDSGLSGKRVELFEEAGKVNFKFSDKDLAEIEHPGGPVDAPFTLYGSLPETPPEKYMNVSGLDDYKVNIADTDSLGSFYVISRRNLELGAPCEKILLSLNTRPNRHEDFHEQIERGLKAFNSECLMEAADTTFISHLERKGLQYKYLAPAITFSPSQMNNSSKKLNNEFGLYPTTWNNDFRMNVFINWTWEEHTIGFDESKNPIVKYSIEFIDDLELLCQMRDYRKGKNVDRIVAFSHAILHAFMLDKNNVLPKNMRNKINLLPKDRVSDILAGNLPQKPKKLLKPYGSSKFSPYGRKRF